MCTYILKITQHINICNVIKTIKLSDRNHCNMYESRYFF